MWWIFLGYVIASTIFSLIGYVVGWHAGTKDTERRWSEAVGRAKDRG